MSVPAVTTPAAVTEPASSAAVAHLPVYPVVVKAVKPTSAAPVTVPAGATVPAVPAVAV